MNIYLFKKEFEKTDLGFDYFNLSVMREFYADGIQDKFVYV